MKQNTSATEPAQDIAIQALAFIAGDETILARFLDLTGWTPQGLNAPEARTAILTAALDYLMSEEDLLLTFAANSGLDPTDIVRAHRALQGAQGV